MSIEESRDPKRFTDFERDGWNAASTVYDTTFGSVTRKTVEATLDAATRLEDLAGRLSIVLQCGELSIRRRPEK